MMYDNEGMPIGSMDELNMSYENMLHADADIPALTFNDPHGDVGLHALDSNTGKASSSTGVPMMTFRPHRSKHHHGDLQGKTRAINVSAHNGNGSTL